MSFVCKEKGCGSKYDSKADLDFHIGKRHNFGNQGAFGCPLCDKRYVCVEDLDFHKSRRHAADSTPSPPIVANTSIANSNFKPRAVTAMRSAGTVQLTHSSAAAAQAQAQAEKFSAQRRQTSPAPRIVSLSEGLHVAIRARNAPEQNELSFSVGDKLLVLKLDPAHSRVYASNESRGSVAGWAPSAALRPATDAEIATRVSGVSTAYVANNAGSISGSPAPPASPPDDDLDNGPTQYSNGVSHLRFPSGDSSAESLPDVRPVARTPSATRINRVMEAADQQYGIRPRGTITGASSTFVDPYATVASDIVENMDRVAAMQQREGVATGYGMQRPPPAAAAAAAPMPPQMEGVARGYSSGAAGTPSPQLIPTGYTRPGIHPQQNLRAQQHGAPTEQYGQLQLIPRENEQAAPDPTLFY